MKCLGLYYFIRELDLFPFIGGWNLYEFITVLDVCQFMRVDQCPFIRGWNQFITVLDVCQFMRVDQCPFITLGHVPIDQKVKSISAHS